MIQFAKKAVGILILSAILVAIGAAIVSLIWGWQDALTHFLVACIVGAIFASVFFVPALLVFLIRERSFTRAWKKVWRFWLELLNDISSQV